MTTQVAARSGQLDFNGTVVPNVDPATEVRQAWAAAYNKAFGKWPPKALFDRFAGKVREVIRTDPDVDEWRDWWHAAQRAGASGAWDLVGYYQPRPAAGSERSRIGRIHDLADRLEAQGL